MANIKQWPLAGIVLGLLAAGCGEPTSVGGRGRGTTAYERGTEMAKFVHKPPPPTTGMGKENKITGTQDPAFIKPLEPQRQALEQEYVVQGTVSASGGGSLSIDAKTGGVKTLQTIPEIQIYNAGDSRFFAQPMPGPGTFVSVIAYTKNGQDYARLVEIGENGVIVPTKNKK